MMLEFFDGTQWQSLIPAAFSSSRSKGGTVKEEGHRDALEKTVKQLEKRVAALERALKKKT